MKKILFVALAAFGLTACVQNEELAAPQGDAIAFDTFVDNATKAAQDGSYSNTNIFSSFQVWGTMENSAKLNIFAGVEVNNATGVWAYASQYTQYWIDGYTYDFAAVVDGVVEGGEYNMPATISTNLEEQKDVLYATASRAYSAGQAATPVELIFKHLLSKVKFTVKNTMTADSGFNYTVSNITIKDADKLGAYDVATATWAGSETYDVDFGMVTTDNATVAKLEAGDEAESNYERLLLPSDAKSLTVAVTYARAPSTLIRSARLTVGWFSRPTTSSAPRPNTSRTTAREKSSLPLKASSTTSRTSTFALTAHASGSPNATRTR